MVDISRREFLKRAGGVIGSLALAEKLLADDETVNDKTTKSLKQRITELYGREKKGVSFLGETIGFWSIKCDRKPRIALISQKPLSNYPTWTDGENIYHSVPEHLDIAGRFFEKADKLEQEYENRRNLPDLKDENIFYEKLGEDAYWQAMSRLYENFKDSPDKVVEFAESLMKIIESHEVPTIAIQKKKAPQLPSRYRISNQQMFEAIHGTGSSYALAKGLYFDSYFNMKVLGILNMATQINNDLEPASLSFACLAGWMQLPEKASDGYNKKKDPYYKAAELLLEEVSKNVGTGSKQKNLVEFLDMPSSEKARIFRNIAHEIYTVSL